MAICWLLCLAACGSDPEPAEGGAAGLPGGGDGGGGAGGGSGPCVPVDETCNGQDDDCDGTVDEELGTQLCTSGLCSWEQDRCVDGAINLCEARPGREICGRVQQGWYEVTAAALGSGSSWARLAVTGEGAIVIGYEVGQAKALAVSREGGPAATPLTLVATNALQGHPDKSHAFARLSGPQLPRDGLVPALIS